MLLNLISEVKARLDAHVDGLAFPIPQFIVVGKQSVGKSRLIEGLAGEPFNFVSGTLGSRRPTVLEFRNVPGLSPSKWSVFDAVANQWTAMPVSQVMVKVGEAHNSLGTNVSDAPIRVKVEGADCVDLGLVDLPGFRAYAKDDTMRILNDKIEAMVMRFMTDDNNVMICVEEAGDAAGFNTLAKCRSVDPNYRRTVLVRNKLDKYYSDLTTENVNKWLEGYGDLPQTLARFSLSLPHWMGEEPPKPFGELRTECSQTDQQTLVEKGMSAKYARTVGFQYFRSFVEVKIQQMFAEALGPLLTRMNMIKEENDNLLAMVEEEEKQIDEHNILHATRSAGICFSQSFGFLMNGSLTSESKRRTLEEELRCFHQYCNESGCISEDARNLSQFASLDEYVSYLRDTVRVPGMDVELNGGAQFRRLMYEAEVFMRFSGHEDNVQSSDVIQARGSGLRSTSWEDIIVTLMLQTAPTAMRARTKYISERLVWFFLEQKDPTLSFMLQIKGSPEEHMFSANITKQAQVIRRNDTMRNCIHKAYDRACHINRSMFMNMWGDLLDSMFQYPLLLLKASSLSKSTPDSLEDEIAPTLESTKERITTELAQRSTLSSSLRDDIRTIPNDDIKANEAVKAVKKIIQKTFAVIRCQVADQMELYSESFFLLPMLRRLEGEMAAMDLEEDDKMRYRARMSVLKEEKDKATAILKDINWSIAEVQKFKITCGGMQ